MEKPSKEFFDSLGQYVYQYMDQEGKVYYIGKGNGDRCASHVTTKGFDLEECYIVARNLEKFENKKDGQSLLLESFLISTTNPDGNSVSGHYKECFTMTSLSSLFTEFKSEQYDMFSQLPDWYINNYSKLMNKLGEVKINSTSMSFKSVIRNKMYMAWLWSPANENDEPIKVSFDIPSLEGEELKSYQVKLKKFLKSFGHTDFHQDGKVTKLCIFVDNIDEVVELFTEFMR